MGIDWEFYLGAEGDDLADAYENNISDDEYVPRRTYSLDDELNQAAVEADIEQVRIDELIYDFNNNSFMKIIPIYVFKNNKCFIIDMKTDADPTREQIEALLNDEIIEIKGQSYYPINPTRYSGADLKIVKATNGYRLIYDKDTGDPVRISNVYSIVMGDILSHKKDSLTKYYGRAITRLMLDKDDVSDEENEIINTAAENAVGVIFPAHYNNYVFTPQDIIDLLDGKTITFRYYDVREYCTVSGFLCPYIFSDDLQAFVEDRLEDNEPFDYNPFRYINMEFVTEVPSNIFDDKPTFQFSKPIDQFSENIDPSGEAFDQFEDNLDEIPF